MWMEMRKWGYLMHYLTYIPREKKRQDSCDICEFFEVLLHSAVSRIEFLNTYAPFGMREWSE